MASAKETVRFDGILHGAGGSATCALQGDRAPGEFHTTNWSIVSVSEPLPPGDYELLAEGKMTQVRYVNGQWLSAD
jgi:hypothetical protein